MHISQPGLALIESFEGFSSRPYWDAYGRVWTRGYGETEGIRASSPAITRAQGEANLRARLERYYEPSIAALGLPLNQNQWDALCSFTWNLGAGIFTGNLRGALERRDWPAVAALMQQYDHAGGVVLEGLRRRRAAEAALFLRALSTAYVPGDELRWCREYDALRGHRSPAAWLRRRWLQRLMLERRRKIWRLASREADGWEHLNRRARYGALLARTRP